MQRGLLRRSEAIAAEVDDFDDVEIPGRALEGKKAVIVGWDFHVCLGLRQFRECALQTNGLIWCEVEQEARAVIGLEIRDLCEDRRCLLGSAVEGEYRGLADECSGDGCTNL